MFYVPVTYRWRKIYWRISSIVFFIIRWITLVRLSEFENFRVTRKVCDHDWTVDDPITESVRSNWLDSRNIRMFRPFIVDGPWWPTNIVWGSLSEFLPTCGNFEFKAKMNQEKEQTATEESICEFCQTEVYEIEHDCLDRDPRTGQGRTKFDSLGPIRSVDRRSVDPSV